MNFNTKHFGQSALYALVASFVTVTMLFAAFFLAEPAISHGQAADTATFNIRQTITAESSFLVNPSNITMSGGINGVTGGQATGTTQFVVQSNNANGYYVEVAFFNNGTPEAMLGDVSASEALRDYSGDVAGQPSLGYTASTAAQFAYTVTSSTTNHTDLSFFGNGSSCNAGASQATTCWKAPATTGFRIVDTTAPAITGATSTITFNVTVPSGATPVPTAETYTATATLSLFVK